MIKSIRKCLNEDIIEFYNWKGMYIYTDHNPLSVAEFKADYDLAKHRVGKDAKLMSQVLNSTNHFIS